MTVRRRDRVAGVWVNRDAATFQGMPAYYYLACTQPLSRHRFAATRWPATGSGCSSSSPSAIGSHHDPSPSARR